MSALAVLPPLRDSLEAHGLLARKSLGQHFLLDLNVTRKIARLAVVGDGDLVLEVGPGPGGLTRALLETGAEVIAIEKDQRFLPLLQELSEAAPGRLRVELADALTLDETALAAGHFGTETLRTKYPKQVVEGVAGTVPLGRLGTEEAFAWLVAYLATPAGDYFSGAVLTLDGARDNWFGPWPPGGLAG